MNDDSLIKSVTFHGRRQNDFFLDLLRFKGVFVAFYIGSGRAQGGCGMIRGWPITCRCGRR